MEYVHPTGEPPAGYKGSSRAVRFATYDTATAFAAATASTEAAIAMMMDRLA